MKFKTKMLFNHACTAAVLGQMRDNRLKLNPEKMEVLWVSALDICGLGASLTFGGVILSAKDEVHILQDPALAQLSTPV